VRQKGTPRGHLRGRLHTWVTRYLAIKQQARTEREQTRHIPREVALMRLRILRIRFRHHL
jgi:hypothetical protein